MLACYALTNDPVWTVLLHFATTLCSIYCSNSTWTISKCSKVKIWLLSSLIGSSIMAYWITLLLVYLIDWKSHFIRGVSPWELALILTTVVGPPYFESLAYSYFIIWFPWGFLGSPIIRADRCYCIASFLLFFLIISVLLWSSCNLTPTSELAILCFFHWTVAWLF